MMEPFVALMRRYCIDYTSSHDQSVCDEIMAPEYVVHISGWDLPRDEAYKPAVTRVYARFPGLQLQVHELITNGERLAMRFSEHGAAADADGRLAAWGGIGLYRWDGKVLLENFVEQDFASQQEQLATGVSAPLEPPHLDPWMTTRAEPASAEVEATLRTWLAKGDLRAADEVVIDGSWYEPLAPSPIEVESVEVNALFSAGTRAAFHVTQRGRSAALRCAGIVRVEGGVVRSVRVITDRLGARRGFDR